MQVLSRKTALAIAISVLLVLSIGTSTNILSTTTAHTPAWQIPTFAYVLALPNPVGVGQATTIYMFLGNPPYPSSAINNDYRFHNYQLSIKDPSGKVTNTTFQTVQDTTNSQYYPFTPTVAGTYNITFDYLGQNVNDSSHDPSTATTSYTNDTFLPSSYSTQLFVQDTPISSLPNAPLPTEFWTRPIYGENTNWWLISSNWLGSGITGYGSMPGPNEQMFSGDSVGPQTSHIMWTKPLQSGGVAGGNNFETQGNSIFEGSAYNQRYTNPIILNGKIYFTESISYTGVSSGPTDCVDLRTGQLIWSKSTIPPLSFGLVWDHEDPNQHGVYPAILFTSNFAQAFDADTGTPLFNVTGVPSGTSVLGPNGEVLKYVMTNLGTSASSSDWRLAEWNSSKLWNYVVNPYTGGSLLSPSIINASAPGLPNLQALITAIPIPIAGTTGTLSNSTAIASTSVTVPYGSTLVVNASVFDSTNAQNRFDYNVTLPWLNNMVGSTFNAVTRTWTNPASTLSVFPGNLLLCRNGSYPALGAYNPYTYFAVNLNASRPGYKIGDVLWSNTIQPPAGKNITTITYAGADPITGTFAESYRQTAQFVGFSLTNGQQIWGPTAPQGALDYYGSQGPGTLADQIAYSHIYSAAYDGVLYCYDMKNGNLTFTYGNGGSGNNTNSGFEVPGPYATFVNAIGNGIVYLITSEHTIETPIYKGALMRAVNATDGTEIWTLSNDNNEFAASSFGIADGFLTTFNGYDNQIYSVGRGPSSTTVSAPDVAVPINTPIVIKGAVTDVSSGTKQNEQAARFPAGVPVSSDASMGNWMGYIYQQQPKPTNFTGVTVSLSVLDSNNNQRIIGNATTDASGAYTFTWLPDITGNYKLFANFEGTNGYWPSSAEESFNVMEVHPTASPTPAPATPMTDTYILASAIAIIIAIAIVGAVIVLMVRKRP
jgi:outer membrane protein assembly factor BamB